MKFFILGLYFVVVEPVSKLVSLEPTLFGWVLFLAIVFFSFSFIKLDNYQKLFNWLKGLF